MRSLLLPLLEVVEVRQGLRLRLLTKLGPLALQDHRLTRQRRHPDLRPMRQGLRPMHRIHEHHGHRQVVPALAQDDPEVQPGHLRRYLRQHPRRQPYRWRSS